MNHKKGFLASLLFVTIGLIMAKPCTADKAPIQDSAKAVEFFEEQMEFFTNPYGVRNFLEEQKQPFTIIDVRQAEAYRESRIPTAINIPFDKYNSFEGNETDFPQLRRDGYNLIYCYEEQCNLAYKAARKFASLGYPVKVIRGGFKSWHKKSAQDKRFKIEQ